MNSYNIELTDDEIFILQQLILDNMGSKEAKLGRAESRTEYVRLIEEVKMYINLYRKISNKY